ncbi:Mitochondrial presequence protease [Coemansia sp. Cherry 401B]|nr:Mitochondrial presequence protease [Coemansia sp. RSA 2705]KAJ2739464.1 Mitochondrial presequence protease [Coemansia sp. Cherry 401B]
MLQAAGRALRWNTRQSQRAAMLARPLSSTPLRRSQGGSDIERGSQLHGFVVEDVQSVSELKLKAVRLRHQRTGLEWLHIDRDDANNVFSIGFNTSVTDSTGVPHILEHTTLCGSERYPVRDPFFKMLNRSLSTFMNAWTAHDYTQYPFSTQNGQDYENLQNVYLDAVFRPLLREVDFRQEGWRLERESELGWQIKGVVYNEMKGAFSDAGALFATRAERQMYTGTTYEHESGGDPQVIPELTYEALVDFHRTRYHPSNARAYSYGNLPLAPQLARVDAAIEGYVRQKPVEVEMQVKPFGEKMVTEFGPAESVGAADKQTKFSVSYLANDLRNVYETFSMSVFSGLLLNGASAPMHQALIDAHIGTDYSPNTGYSPYTRQTSLTVGLQGMADKNIPLVEQRIAETLARVGESGFEQRRVDAALATVELAYKHKTADFGLNLMRSVSTGWFHGVNPVEYLRVSENVERLRADTGVFSKLVDRYLARSQHKLKFVMLADPKYMQGLDEKEHEMIQSKLAALSSADLARVDEQNAELAAEQGQVEDLGALPTLTLDDVAPEAQRFAVDMGVSAESVPVQWRAAATNGISYVRAINAVRDKYPELWPYMPLFCEALTYQGTATRDMAEIETDIRLHTGGISFSPFVSTDLANLGHVEAGISFGTHCLDTHVDRMLELVLELVRETNFGNTARLRALLAAMATNMYNDVASSGHAFARRLAASTLTPEMSAVEQLNGLAQVRFLGDLRRSGDLENIAQRLSQVRDVVFDRATLRTAVTANAGSTDANARALERLLTAYPDAPEREGIVDADKFTPTPGRFFCPLPVATSYAAQATRCVPYTHADSPALQLLAKLLTPGFLHREIRERNGAYGGGSVYSAVQGIFSFFSYRDPMPRETLATFGRSIEWLLSHEVSEREMREAKLSVFGDLDAPLSVSDEGMAYFTAGITDDMRQERRERFFAVTPRDLRNVAETYLAAPDAAARTSAAVIGAEGLDMSGWTRVNV